MKKNVFGIVICLFLVSFLGCSITQKTVKVKEVVLLPEDLIYTIPKGQSLEVLYDNEPMTIVLPTDMKLVSPATLVRQEQKLNNALLDKVKADKNTNKWLG